MQPIKIILSIALFTLCTACGSEMDMEMDSEHVGIVHTEGELDDAGVNLACAEEHGPKSISPHDDKDDDKNDDEVDLLCFYCSFSFNCVKDGCRSCPNCSGAAEAGLEK